MKIHVNFGWTGNLDKPCKATTDLHTADDEIRLEAWGVDFNAAVARLLLKIRAIHSENSGNLPPPAEIDVTPEMLMLPILTNADEVLEEIVK